MENIVGQRPIDVMGFGIIPKLVMLDKELTIEAKAIYGYICSYAGAGAVAFPSVSLICDHLGISKERFQKHKKLLEDKGYIKIVQERNAHQVFAKNKYYIMPSCNAIQEKQKKQTTTTNSPWSGFPCTENPRTENPCTENPCTENLATNNNSFKSNNYKNNSYKNNNKDAVAVSSATPDEKTLEAKDEAETQAILTNCSPALHEAINKFIEYRKSIKAPMSPNAVEALLEMLLEEFASDGDRIKALRTSRINGWRDVYSNNRNATAHVVSPKEAEEAVLEKPINWSWIPQEVVDRAKELVKTNKWKGALAHLDAIRLSTPPDNPEKQKEALERYKIELSNREQCKH